ncbi:hypothetical protein DFH06DRAFT_1486484 [Mycena polygramma]|nr:hypothetical protein DFH06DRAFT_1486484 [Mycena polygramma]
MHRCFHLRNVDNLPLSLRRIASAAADGSLQDLIRLLALVNTSRLTTAQLLLLLPVAWSNLDPADVPSSESLDDQTVVADFHKKPFKALELVHYVKDIPPHALADLWPRVWAWIDFLYTHREAISGVPDELSIMANLFWFIDRIPPTQVDTAAGVRILIAKAWAAFVATGRHDLPGFVELGRFVNATPGGRPDSHITDYAEALGGVDGLASLVFRHISMAWRERSLPFILNSVLFAIRVLHLEPKGSPEDSFHVALRAAGVLGLLTEIIYTLVHVFTNQDVEPVLQLCVRLLVIEITNPAGYLSIPEVIRGGLIQAVVVYAMCDTRSGGYEYLRRLLFELVGSTVYYSVLHELEQSLPAALELMDPRRVRASSISSQWQDFVSVAEDRVRIKHKFDSDSYVPSRACDNLACGRISGKAQFRACSACRTTHYCDKSCQRMDWEGHRVVCGQLKSLRLQEPPTSRDRSFIRALIQDTYQTNKAHIFRLRFANMNLDDPDQCYTSMDFTASLDSAATTEIVELDVLPFVTGTRDFRPANDHEIHQAYQEARARKDPRIHLFSVVFHRQAARIFALRASDGRVHEGFVQLSRAVLENMNGASTTDVGDTLSGLEELAISTCF